MPAAPEQLTEKDGKFRDSLSYIMSSGTAWAKQQEAVSRRKNEVNEIVGF